MAAFATLPCPGFALHRAEPELFWGVGINGQPNLLQKLQGLGP